MSQHAQEQPTHSPFEVFPKYSKLDHVELREASPLADSFRPRTLEEFVGQTHLTGPNTLLFDENSKVTTENIIFWGPPG
jgi:replication-associated recombination protein RarA